VAQDDNVTVAEDQVLHGNVLVANGHGADSDPDGDTITVTAGTFATAHGTVVVHANGDFTYTSTALFHGADSFAYTESDGILQAGATVNITVTPVNHNPVAQEDDFTGSKNQPVTGNVLANNGHGADSDPDGDPLSVLAATLTTANGSHVTLNANGTFTVTPVNGFSGQDSFSYTLLDGQGGAATGTVKVTFSNGAGHGEGNEHVFQCHGGRSFSGDGDNDRFIFDALTQMPSIVKNFNASGDRLDFSQLIHGFNPLQHAIDQYVHATTQGHNTVISVDADGAAHGSHFTQVAVLEGVSHFDVAAALAHGSLIA
jgi:VCBS repeat-containing protein